MAANEAKNDQELQTSRSFLEVALNSYRPRDFAIRFWDGTTWDAEPGQKSRFTLALNHPGALRRMFWPHTDLTLGEAFIFNDFDIEGDIESSLLFGDFLMETDLGIRDKLRLGQLFLNLPKTKPQDARHTARMFGKLHSKLRDSQAVTFHYNLPSNFFSLFLDKNMAYSCAYFIDGEEDIHRAQRQKLDYICRKLRLKPGDRLLDIGCGWGSLIIHAAEHFGVRATGITLSQPQADFARERIAQSGLSDRCHVEIKDYRDVNDQEGFDNLVSVGMVEHVGEKNLPAYFRKAWNLLKPGGVFLNHGISDTFSIHGKGGTSFIHQYVFPDSELVPISVYLNPAEKEGFEVRDVESLREHYALTLRHWVKRLEENKDEAIRITDEVTFRIWRLYMSGCAHSFNKGDINVYQTLLVKPEAGRSGLPLTRSDWYA